ncbi:unnamed protein product, partial [Polarella glacialis]
TESATFLQAKGSGSSPGESGSIGQRLSRVEPRRGQRKGQESSSSQGSQTKLLRQLLSLGPGASLNEVQEVIKTQLERWDDQPKLATVVLKALATEGWPEVAQHVLRIMRAAGVGVNEFHVGCAVNSC